MARTANVHNNSQFAVLLAPLTLTTALSATGTTPVTKLGGMKYLVAEAIFLYGSGGTTAKAYVQTSLDGGTTWMDIICFAFTTSALSKVSAVSADIAFAASAYVPIAPGDGALADNTSIQGILGDRLRVKYVTTGTYAGASSIAVYAHAKG
jgi:hypothetical protein